VPADGAGCGRSFGANLKFSIQQMARALLGHKHHDQVNTFHSDLRSPIAPSNGEEGGSAPTAVGCAAGGNAVAAAGAKNEAALEHTGNNRHAFGAFHDLLWDALFRGIHNFVEHLGGVFQAQFGVGLVLRPPG
jgi:hypothetical protein